jgi:hypothetical protein
MGRVPMAEVHVRTLRRAAKIMGGEQQLALKLKVTPSHLALWLAGVATPPGGVFLLAVDLVSDDELSRLAAARERAPSPES